SEIRTALLPCSANRTAVSVEFLVPRTGHDLAAIGARYAGIYKRLWDQDEAMMMRRDRIIEARRRTRSANPRGRTLGRESEVRARAPLIVRFGGEPFRIVDLEGELLAHAVTCPHWLGPLDQAAVVDGCVRCPWHGYRFDVRTGLSADGRNLSLPRPPRI